MRLRGLAEVCLLGGLSAVFVYRSLWLPLQAIPKLPADFAHYHAAARSILSGESPYRVAEFDYPPLPALLLLPLAPLPLTEARFAWFGASWLALAGAAALAWRALGGDRASLAAVAGVWALSGTVPENLVIGQLNPLLLLLVATAGWGLVRSSSRTTNGAIALAAGLKLWPAALVLVDGLARRGGAPRLRRLAAGAVAVLALLAASWAPLLLLPPPRLPQTAGYWRGTPALFNVSLPAVALRLADPPRDRGELPPDWVHGNDPKALSLPPRRAALAVAVAVATLTVGLALLLRLAPPEVSAEGSLLALAGIVALALAASPVAWYHYQLLELPGLALLALRALRRGVVVSRACRLAGLALLGAGLTWTHQLGLGAYLARHGWTAASPAWLWLGSSLVPVLCLVLFGLYLAELRRP
jgi:hypothetical protein